MGNRAVHIVRVLVAALLVTGMAACSGSSSDSTAPTRSSATGTSSGETGGWVVTLGDSYVSGEGTRWAGNTTGSPGPVDAQGPHAYWDTPSGQSIPGCDRSRQSIADVGAPYRGMNLACSGATTTSQTSGSQFKPGIDLYAQPGAIGQALSLRRFAATHPVSSVVLGIGGNDFGFGSIVATCSADFLTSMADRPTLCSHDRSLLESFTPGNVATVRDKIAGAITEVAGAMQQAGYDRSQYSIVVVDYPDPIPPANLIRYPETHASRGDVGGCPIFDQDADWAANTLVATIDGAVADAVAHAGLSNVGLLDMRHAFDGHRLCEKGVGQLSDEPSLSSWRSPDAAAKLEWVNRVYDQGGPWQLQESFHPNFFGMLAERSCIAAALATSPPTYGSCLPGKVAAGGTPTLTLEP